MYSRHTCNPSTWEAEARGKRRVQGQPGLHIESISKERKDENAVLLKETGICLGYAGPTTGHEGRQPRWGGGLPHWGAGKTWASPRSSGDEISHAGWSWKNWAGSASPVGALPVISPPSTVTPHLHLLFCPLPLVSLWLPYFISSSREQPDVCIWCCSSCGWHPAQQPRRCGWPPGTQGGSWRSPWQVGPDVKVTHLKVGGVVPG